MSGTTKPRFRVPAGSSKRATTTDSFQNFSAGLGYGAGNIASGSSYGFNPISRNHVLLEWAYRGSWLVRKVIDCTADDMTREGLAVESDMPPDQIDRLNQYWLNKQIWRRLNSTLKWARLYGGCIAAIMIRGQDPATPLRTDTIRRGQFDGLIVLDRWMLQPNTNDLVTDAGSPNYGTPRFYDVVADSHGVPSMRIHHSRCIRFDGIELPYWQRLAENSWGLSILEPLWDRMIAFDSVTQGAAQLIYKAHLRVLKLPDLRNLIASGGPIYQAVLRQIQMIRATQSNEGLTVLDGEDSFEANQYSFAGLSDMMVQFSQQVSGAADVPMTRLFGQSPAGMNATGDSDLRNYYDATKSSQEGKLRQPVTLLLDVTHRSEFGQPLPEGFNFSFKPLWQLQESEKSTIAATIAGAVSQLMQDGVFTPEIGMKEIRQSSRVTGFGSNITDEDMQNAMAPPMPDPGMDPAIGQALPAGVDPAGAPGQPGGLADNPAVQPPAAPAHETVARLAGKAAGATAGGASSGTGTDVPDGSATPLSGPLETLSTRLNLDPGLRGRVNLLEQGTQVNLDSAATRGNGADPGTPRQ